MARKNLLKGFKKPKGITFEHSKVDPDYGKFIAYPFERGFGTTIGNTLRRVLLSSIQGYAVTAVKFTSYDEEGNPHIISSEYESIPGVAEDTTDIISRLKKLKLKMSNDVEQKLLLLECKGLGAVTGERFAVDGVEVANTDLVIMNLMEDANFDMEVQIDLSRGYIPAEQNEKYIEEIGTIPIDAVFSPVRRVRYAIENTRVGQRSDYDKLILEVFTDGTITPDNALAEAAKIAKDHFSIFINFD